MDVEDVGNLFWKDVRGS